MTRAVSLADGALLARLAAAAVGARLAGRRVESAVDGQPLPINVHEFPALVAKAASFVTLERQGTLRGCVGSLEAARPLYRDVLRNAVRAMNDPRLPPVGLEDWPDLDVKVSVLGAPEPLFADSRAELVAALRPGVDGLILTDGRRRATFLPAVWDKLPDPERYVAALLNKGGWPDAEDWPKGIAARRYRSMEFRDPAPREAFVV
jgi:AmmeMemoRadiSam system protein A